ncbi:MAG: hypothetical protein OXI87_13215 [Albidovulum sp.]|nr:hypothetical protein [Albidovulum sp.]MDE0305818.1 hypothetical protein [Albidovulum sp.]
MSKLPADTPRGEVSDGAMKSALPACAATAAHVLRSGKVSLLKVAKAFGDDSAGVATATAFVALLDGLG